MTQTISVPFEEHEDSPIERGTLATGFQFTRIFLVEYASRFTFLYSMFEGGVAGKPKAYHSNFPALLCSTFDIERIENKPTGPNEITDPVSQIIEHDTIAKITIEYAPLQYDNDLPNGTFATYNQAGSVEFIDSPGRGMKWESSDERLPADVRPVVPIGNTRHEVTWHQVSNVPWALLETLKGRVNSTAFRIPALGRTVPAGNLMFLDSSSEQTTKYNGDSTTSLTLAFVEKNQGTLSSSSYGWNHKYNPDTGLYDRPISDTGDPLFQSGNFGDIFA